MAKYPSKYPEWLYDLNHGLMIVSLFLILLLMAVTVIVLPLGKIISFEFLEWWDEVLTLGFPILLVLLIISSGVFVNGFVEHRVKWVSESEMMQNRKTVKEFSDETKLYYKRWGIVSLVCFILLFLLFLVFLLVDEKLYTVISCMIAVCFFLCGAGFIIFIKGWEKGVFFSTKK